MAYLEISSAQLEALKELDRGRYGVRVHEDHAGALRVDVFVNADGRFRPAAVSKDGEIIDLMPQS